MIVKPEIIRTLGGCLLYKRQNKLLIIREWIKCEIIHLNTLKQHQKIKWDGRFELNTCLPINGSFTTLRSLGEHGWQQVCQYQASAALRDIPYLARLALPTLWQNNKIISICHFPRLLSADGFIKSVEFAPTNHPLPTLFKML